MTMIRPPILLLAAPRVGTHLLRSCLSQDPQILDIGEFLHPKQETRSEENFWNTYETLKPPDAYLDSVVPLKRLTVFRHYLKSLARKYPDRIILADLKYNHIGAFDSIWRMPDRTPAPLQAFLEAGAAVIHLVRRNPLTQYASACLAHETGNWVEWTTDNPGVEDTAKSITIDIDTLVDELQRIQFRVEVADRWIARHGKILRLVYEDLMTDSALAPAVAASITDLTGASIQGVRPKTQKIAPPLETLVENIQDVRHALQATAFASCLGEEPPCRNVPHRRPDADRGVIILASPRAGTHMLRSALSKLPEFTVFGEVFNPDVAEQGDHHFSRFYRDYICREPAFVPSSESAETVLLSYFLDLESHAGQSRYVIDIKSDAMRIFDWPPRTLAAMPKILEFVMELGFPLLFVSRRDLLAQYASLELALQTDRWVSFAERDDAVKPQKMRLDPRKALHNCLMLEATRTAFRTWLTQYPRVAWVEYEDLIGDKVADGVLRDKIAQVTGVSITALDPATVKIAPPLKNLIENFEEVLAAFDGTPLAWISQHHR